jgi:chemotaxis protein CheZ
MADGRSNGLTLEALGAIQVAANELPDACERLLYVKQMTEQAANKVFSLIDQLQADAAALRALAQAPDAAAIQALADRQQAVSTELMMSQEFQDLSGQVINKVVKLLESVERPLHQVLAQAGDAATEAMPLDSGELTGVQTPDKALQQDDVDDLLASLGF